MPPPSFYAQIQATTQGAVRNVILAALGALGFQVTAWGEFSFPLRTVNGISTMLADALLFIVEVAKGGYGETARNGWVDLWAWDRFQILRLSETFTTGVVRLVDAGAGPHVVAGGLIIGTSPDDGRTFESTADVTVPLNGTATVAVRATAPGSRFNLATGVGLRLVTDLPTVLVTNPAQTGTETWITSAGADRESDAGLVARARLQWAELSVATPAKYYASKIRKAVPTITKIRVLDDNPLGPGSAELILATGAGPASGADVTLAISQLPTIRSVASGVLSARAAVARTIAIGGIAYVTAAQRDAVRAAVATDLATMQADADIGATVYAAEIIRIVKSKAGVRDFLPDTGVVNTTVGDDEVVTLVHEIQYVAE